MLLVLGTAAAPTSRELLAAPLICSFTVNVQPPRLVELCRDLSDVRTTGLKRANGEDKRFAIQRDQRGKRKPLLFIQVRDADLALVAAEQKDLRLPIAIPVGHGQIADTGQSRKDLWGGQRAILLLQEEGN